MAGAVAGAAWSTSSISLSILQNLCPCYSREASGVHGRWRLSGVVLLTSWVECGANMRMSCMAGCMSSPQRHNKLGTYAVCCSLQMNSNEMSLQGLCCDAGSHTCTGLGVLRGMLWPNPDSSQRCTGLYQRAVLALTTGYRWPLRTNGSRSSRRPTNPGRWATLCTPSPTADMLSPVSPTLSLMTRYSSPTSQS